MADTQGNPVELRIAERLLDNSQQNTQQLQSEDSNNSKKRQIDPNMDDFLPASKMRRIDVDDTGYAVSLESESDEQKENIIHQPKPCSWQSQHLKHLYEFGDLDYDMNMESDSPNSDEKVSAWIDDTLLATREYRRRNCHSESSMKIPTSANAFLDAPPGLLRRSAPPSLDTAPFVADFSVLRSPSTQMSDISLDDNVTESLTSYGSSYQSSDSFETGHLYRDINLASNGIFLRVPGEPFPEYVSTLINMIRQDRELFPWQLTPDANLMALEMGAARSDVVTYFGGHVFPYPVLTNIMKRCDAQEMFSFTVPSTGSHYEVNTPQPDMLYGYDLSYLTSTFSLAEFSLLCSMDGALVVNTQNLVCPYFLIEVTADGASDCGSLWHATNRCLGGSAACVNVAEQLNEQLRRHRGADQLRIESACFSVAMNGTEARLYVTWKDGELFRMQKVESFLLQRESDFQEFQKVVWNIVEWGREMRFEQFQEALGYLMGEWMVTS